MAQLVFWWISITKGAQNSSQAGHPSVMLWRVPALHVAVSDAFRERYGIRIQGSLVGSCSASVFVCAMRSSLAIVILRWAQRYMPEESYIPIRYDKQQSLLPRLCMDRGLTQLLQDFFTEPGIKWYRIAQTVQFALCSVVFFRMTGWLDPKANGAASAPPPKMHWLGTALSCAMLAGYVILGAFQIITMSLRGAACRTNSSDVDCTLVMIMMDPKLGMGDVAFGRAWRVVGSVPTVYGQLKFYVILAAHQNIHKSRSWRK